MIYYHVLIALFYWFGQKSLFRFFCNILRKILSLFLYSVQFSSVAQSCPTLSDPMDCSLPGSSVHGIFQTRVLEWSATAFSKTTKPRWQQICSHGLLSILSLLLGFPGGTVVKNLPCQCRSCRRQVFNPWVRKNPLQYSCLENSMDRVGYSPAAAKSL